MNSEYESELDDSWTGGSIWPCHWGGQADGLLESPRL